MVRSFSPVKIELAPARKQSVTASCERPRRPAARRTRDAGIRMRAVAMARTMMSGSSSSAAPSGVPLLAHQQVDRNAFRMGIKARELLEQADAVFLGLAQAEDSTAADSDASLTHVRDGFQAVFVNSGSDDFAVELGRGIEIVVVGAEAGLFQALGLGFGKHAKCAADFQIERGDAADHFQYAVEILAVIDLTPGRAHAKSRGAFGFRAPGRVEYLGGAHQLLACYAGFVMRALRAIGAIFRATAGLNREQAAKLDLSGAMEFAVN